MDTTLVDINSECKLGHIGVIQAVTADTLLAGPLADGLHIFLQAIAQHRSALFIGDAKRHLARYIGLPRCHGAGVIHVEQQQLRRQLAVVESVLLVAAKAYGFAVLGRTGEYAKPPARQRFLNGFTQAAIKTTQLLAFAQALAVGRVNQHQASLSPGLFAAELVNSLLLDGYDAFQASPLQVVPCGLYHPSILVKAQEGRNAPLNALLACIGALLGFLAQ